jgi:hypothetical protein
MSSPDADRDSSCEMNVTNASRRCGHIPARSAAADGQMGETADSNAQYGRLVTHGKHLE